MWVRRWGRRLGRWSVRFATKLLRKNGEESNITIREVFWHTGMRGIFADDSNEGDNDGSTVTDGSSDG